MELTNRHEITVKYLQFPYKKTTTKILTSYVSYFLVYTPSPPLEVGQTTSSKIYGSYTLPCPDVQPWTSLIGTLISWLQNN